MICFRGLISRIGMGNKRRSVRFDEHTWMLLKEVSEKMGVNMSVVIRSMVARSLREITDDPGNLILNEKQVQAK